MKSILEPYKDFILKSYQDEPIPTLTFANKKDVLKFFKCYNDLDFFLERKYNVFLQKINHSSYDKYK